MKIIITGGAGFIGSHAIKHFATFGDYIINVDKLSYAANVDNLAQYDQYNDKSLFYQLDIRDTPNLRRLVKEFKPDYLLNFAAETHVDNSILSVKEFVESNVEGVASVLNVCKETNTKLCHVSTDEVYGPADNTDGPFREYDRLNPMNPYSATKAAGDMLIRSFHNTHKIPYVMFRPSNNFGPGQHQEKFIPKLLQCINQNEKFPLYGDGLQEREWTYVKDTVEIIRKLILREISWASTYNITSGISKTNRDVILSVLKTYNDINMTNLTIDDVTKNVVDRKGHDKKYWISSDLINCLISPKYTDFDDVIKELIKQNK